MPKDKSTQSSTASPLPKVSDIQRTLWVQMQGLIENKTSPANLNALTNASGKIIALWNLKIKAAALFNKQPTDTGFLEIEDKPAAPTQAVA